MIKKTLFFSTFYTLLFYTTLFAQDISGFWKSMNDKTGKPACIVAVYEYQDKHYGRIIGIFDEDGNIHDSIYTPKERAPGVKDNPFYCGLDIIWNLRNKGVRNKGKILDPEKGKIYDAEVWVKQGNLIVRGEFLFFGRSVVWLPALDNDFPSDFKKPDVNTFIPQIPKVK